MTMLVPVGTCAGKLLRKSRVFFLCLYVEMLRVDVDSVLNRKKDISVQMFVDRCLNFAIYVYGGLTGLKLKFLQS